MQGNRERGCFGLATGAFERTLGRAAEEARWRIKDARKGSRGWKAQEAGRHEARVTGGRLAKLAGGWRKYAPEMLFADHEGSVGSLRLFLRVFGAQQGSLGLKGYGLAVPLSFHRFIIISN